MPHVKRIVGALFLLLQIGVVRAAVTAENLPALVPGGVGIETGLTVAVWGTPLSVEKVTQQLRDLGAQPLSAPERALFRRIVLTGTGTADLLIPRLEALTAQGLFDDILILTDRLPPADRTPAVQLARARALTALGRGTEVCSEDMLASLKESALPVRTICALSFAAPAEAVLSFDVYRDSGRDGFPFLNAAGDILTRSLPASLPDGHPDILELAPLARAFGTEVLQLPLSRGDLTVLATHEQVPSEVRSAATDRLSQLPDRSDSDGVSALSLLLQRVQNRIRLETLIPDLTMPEATDAAD